MNKSLMVDLFVEDNAQLQFLRAAVERIAHEESCEVKFQERSIKGGHPRLKQELSRYQFAIDKGVVALPDLAVIGWDANCKGSKARHEVEAALREPLKTRSVIACPEPHIERWYMIDDHAFGKVVGSPPGMATTKCQRDYYKRLLLDAARNAGQVVTLEGAEFAADIVSSIDWFRAGKVDGAFRRFVAETRSALRRH